MSDLDFDELVHTAEGRLVLEVIQQRRLPILIVVADRGDIVFWHPPTVADNMVANPEGILQMAQLLEDYAAALRGRVAPS
jgi:hypothetical protein